MFEEAFVHLESRETKYIYDCPWLAEGIKHELDTVIE